MTAASTYKSVKVDDENHLVLQQTLSNSDTFIMKAYEKKYV